MKKISVILSLSTLVLSLNLLHAQLPATRLDHPDSLRALEKMKTLNSRFEESALCLSTDGKTLYFVSDRGGQDWSGKAKIEDGGTPYNADLWYSKFGQEGWNQAVCVEFGINSAGQEDLGGFISDGKQMFFLSKNAIWKSNGGPIYKANFQAGVWVNAKGLGGGITDFFVKKGGVTDGFTISQDGKRMVFAWAAEVNAPMDLYLSMHTSKGWTWPHILRFNTPGDERSPYFSADSRTIYFASDGYVGLGGLDIFKSNLKESGTWSQPINLGAPFNSEKDETSFVLAPSGMFGFLIRKGDIYWADLSAVKGVKN